jgi:alkanesulfonate monooxygenase SsuD/methylene tetrahydromethanopterin reductase-like flavin-dependent oxidoreductase (luciferase family)
MRLCVFTEPQFGATYDDQLAVALQAEACGYEAFFRSDHLLTMGGGDGLPGPRRQLGIVGGHGRKRTPALAARYADEFNVPFGTLADTRRQ